MVKLSRFDVCLIDLEPTIGAELRKIRPCVIISPDEMNLSNLKTIIIAPVTSTIRMNYPTRISIFFDEKNGQVPLDQIRVVDRIRIIKKLGTISKTEQQNILRILHEMFEE